MIKKKHSSNISDTFCVLPWMHVATNTFGDLRVCCVSFPEENQLLKDDDSIYNIYNDSIEDAWKSKTYKKLRNQFLVGDQPNMCRRCFTNENLDMPSSRQHYNRLWAGDYELTDEPSMNIRYIDIRLGNLCNLKCRMCNPYASTQWINEWPGLTKEQIEKLSSINWFESEHVWDKFSNILDTVEEIYLAGGEPTIIKQQYQLLNQCIKSDQAKNITLKYNSNIATIPQKLLDLWTHFRKIKMRASIDGIGDLNHYIRYPSNWTNIEKNYKNLLQIQNIRLQVHCTVQAYNILYLDNFLDWFNEYNQKTCLVILDQPNYLDIRVLPDDLKTIVKDRLEKYRYHSEINGILNYIETDHLDLWDEFKNFTNKLDLNRNQNILNIIPEFKKYWS